MMLVVGFGWAKPVPINVRNFRDPKRGMALSALAGPAVNAIFGVLGAVLYGVFAAYNNYLIVADANPFLVTCVYYAGTLFHLSALYNLLFMAFNLIPIPPFDGSRIALVFLPPKTYFGLMRYEKQIMFGLLIALMLLSRLGFSPFSWVAKELTYFIANSVYKLSAGFFQALL
jgi:Zn-dependent protease